MNKEMYPNLHEKIPLCMQTSRLYRGWKNLTSTLKELFSKCSNQHKRTFLKEM